MKNESNNPHILGGSSPPDECPTNLSHVTTESSWMTVEEAACYIRCSIKTLYNHKCNGSIKGHNSGGKRKGKLLFKKSDLDAFITGRRGV